MTRSLGWLGLLAAMLLASCASSSNDEQQQSAANPNRRCFFASNITSFAPVDTRTVNMRVGVNEFFRVDLMQTCRDATWPTGMSLVTRGGSTICTGPALGTTLVTNRGPTRSRCSVRTITALTPEEAQALSGAQRP